jgi:hypothetical protein
MKQYICLIFKHGEPLPSIDKIEALSGKDLDDIVDCVEFDDVPEPEFEASLSERCTDMWWDYNEDYYKVIDFEILGNFMRSSANPGLTSGVTWWKRLFPKT